MGLVVTSEQTGVRQDVKDIYISSGVQPYGQSPRTGGSPAMYRVRGNHAADHDPACLLLPGPRRARLFMQVRRVSDDVCLWAEEGRLALPFLQFA